jgi:uncharacterized membrane protein required for colicin V production
MCCKQPALVNAFVRAIFGGACEVEVAVRCTGRAKLLIRYSSPSNNHTGQPICYSVINNNVIWDLVISLVAFTVRKLHLDVLYASINNSCLSLLIVP